MKADAKYPRLQALQRAKARGDIEAIRKSLFELDEDERSLLQAELGEGAVRVLYRAARRRRKVKRGRVIVINGIMGAYLDSTFKDGDIDRVWINYLRLIGGRIADLRLESDGQSSGSEVKIHVAGIHDTYLPMLLELDQSWNVLPFAFDWRLDIDKSAERLAAAVREWAKDEPVHIVAHSMGGLVSRRFIQLFPHVWAKMKDTSGDGRGGRLVMLGTPNHGSFAIPLALSGEERLVKLLILMDVKHDREELLDILNSFPGSYQMLPSPAADLNDDHEKLYSGQAWGKYKIRQALLDRAKEFHSLLDAVIDPERMLYIAGYGIKTPFRIEVEKPGVFRYGQTRKGDGRVPHELGLLDGVKTFWIPDQHGDLVRNERVLAGLESLLVSGETDELESQQVVDRLIEEPGGWMSPDEFEALPPELEFLRKAKRGRAAAKTVTALTEEERKRVEALMVSDYLADPRDGAAYPLYQEAAPRGPGKGRQAPSKPHKVRVEVVWGDIAEVEGDVYCVGHYQNVLPQAAEEALDRAVSGKNVRPENCLIRKLTIQGVLRGAIGDVNFYPWIQSGKRIKQVAVAGMGHPGSFTSGGARRLACNLAWAIGSLPNLKTVCTVLIGSGDGALSINEAVKSFLNGVEDALQMGLKEPFKTLRIVEFNLQRAHAILNCLKQVIAPENPNLQIDLAPAIIEKENGAIADDFGLALTVAAAAKAAHSETPAQISTLLRRIPAGKRRKRARESLAALGKASGRKTLEQLASELQIDHGSVREGAPDVPTRISFTKEEKTVSVAAISNTVVVPRKNLGIDFNLVLEAARKATNPDLHQANHLSTFLNRFLMPQDFRPLLSEQKPLIFEVDRSMAVVQWELLSSDVNAVKRGQFVGLMAPVARQLRTSYSPPPLFNRPNGERLKALVVGDPGDPAEGHGLPGARLEAQRVVELLRERGFLVKALIGAPTKGEPPFAGTGFASRLDVLDLLYEGDFDLLHYAGHGDFDPEDPSRVGWVFKGGLITAAELERMDKAPQLVVANACLSSRTSAALAYGKRVEKELSEAALLPSLADEFFHRGVRNYIGTAWEVDDAGAILFTDTFYRNFLPDPRKPGSNMTIGESMLQARQALYDKSARYGSLWAAYQHYGDPLMKI